MVVATQYTFYLNAMYRLFAWISTLWILHWLYNTHFEQAQAQARAPAKGKAQVKSKAMENVHNDYNTHKKYHKTEWKNLWTHKHEFMLAWDEFCENCVKYSWLIKTARIRLQTEKAWNACRVSLNSRHFL